MMMFVLDHFWSLYFSIGAIVAGVFFVGAMNRLDTGDASPVVEMMLSLVWVKAIVFAMLVVVWPYPAFHMSVSISKRRGKR